MSPEELKAARKWGEEPTWTRLTPYGRETVKKLCDEVERLQKRLEWWETPEPVAAETGWDEGTR